MTSSDDTPPSATLQPFRFTTADVPAHEQFDAWREHVRAIADISPRDAERAACPVEVTSWDLGGFVFCHERNPGASFLRSTRRVKTAPVDHWYLFLLENGSNWTVSLSRADGSEQTTRGHRGTLGLYSLGDAVQGEMVDIATLILFVPRDLFPGLAGQIDRSINTLLDTPLAGLLADHMRSLHRHLPAMHERDLPNLRHATRAMLAACLAPSTDRVAEAGPVLATVRRERALRLIRDSLGDPRLGPDMMARTLGLSRSEIYRLFEPEGGVARHIQTCRLAAAHDALTDPGETRRIHQIAEAFGFSDGQSFSRAFQRHFGYRPSEVRPADPMPLGKRRYRPPKGRAPSLGTLLRGRPGSEQSG